MGVGM